MKLTLPLNLISIEDIEQIPQNSGIYYCFYDAELTYITYSLSSLRESVKTHLNRGRRFTHVCYARFQQKPTSLQLRSTLKDLIQYFQPPENKRYNIYRSSKKVLPNFIILQNQQLIARLAELEAMKQPVQSSNLLINQVKSTETASILSQKSSYRFVSVESKLIDLEGSNESQNIEACYTLPKPIISEETPPLALPSIVEPEPKVLTLQQKLRANVISLFNRAFYRGGKT